MKGNGPLPSVSGALVPQLLQTSFSWGVVGTKLWSHRGWKDGRTSLYRASSIHYHDALDIDVSGKAQLEGRKEREYLLTWLRLKSSEKV